MKTDAVAPDFGRGFLRIPLPVWIDLYCRAPLTRRQLQLVSVVLRESWGWQTKGGAVYRWTRPLTPGQFAHTTGLSTDHLTRDLQALVARGVLRAEGGRYQLVGDPRLWKTCPTPPPNVRSRAPKHPISSDKTALLPPDVKTAKIRQRNVPVFPEGPLSTIVDNSLPPDRTAHGALSASAVNHGDRFCEIVATFAGGMAEAEVNRLQQWISEVGMAEVWATLGPRFRIGPAAVRAALQNRLGEPAGGGE